MYLCLQCLYISNNPVLPLTRIKCIIITLQEPVIQKNDNSLILLCADHSSRRLQHLIDSRIPECVIKSKDSLFIIILF